MSKKKMMDIFRTAILAVVLVGAVVMMFLDAFLSSPIVNRGFLVSFWLLVLVFVGDELIDVRLERRKIRSKNRKGRKYENETELY